MKPVVFAFAMIMVSGIAWSQDSSSAGKVQFKLGLNYNTALNYYGRTDSIKSTGFFAVAELWFTKQLYVSAAPVFVNNSIRSFDYAGTVATVGYLQATTKWIHHLYILKPFYKKDSRLLQAALKAQAGGSISFLSRIINLSAGGDLKYSDKIDVGAMAGIDHTFRRELKNNSVLVIDPSFYMYAGTQNFSSTYFKNKPGFLFLPGTPQRFTENVTKFNVLAYEFSVPLIYAKGKWMALVTPSYVLPQNLVSVKGRDDLAEKGNNMLYATLGLKWSFR